MSKQELKYLKEQLINKLRSENKRFIFELTDDGISIKEKKFEVEVPEEIDTYYTIDIVGRIQKIGHYQNHLHEHIYKRGESFKTEEDAMRYCKERLLLFKIKKWAEIHNDGWVPDAENERYYIYYDTDDNKLWVDYNRYYNYFSKLPYFKTEEIAQACIDEFGDEILEVLCK